MTKVVILGAGVVGAAIAYELSLLPNFEITILDTGKPATGSTSAALGVLMGIISRKTKGRAWTLRRRSMARFPELLKELAEAGHPVPHNPHGILKLFSDPEELEKGDRLKTLRQESGWNLNVWDQATVQQNCPNLNTEAICGGIFSPQDFQVQPIPLTQSLLTVAQQNGVNCYFEVAQPELIFEDQRCTNIQVKQGSPLTSSLKLRLKKGGILECDWLIVAAGLGSLEITKPLLESFEMKPILGQAFHVKAKGEMPINQDFQPVVSFEDIHVVPLGDGEFWVGATVEFPDEMGRVNADQRLMEDVWQRAIAFYPELKGAEILRHWSGKRPRPEGQGAPIIQPLQGYKNILLATGHYRNGVLLAPATALTIRDWLLDPQKLPHQAST